MTIVFKECYPETVAELNELLTGKTIASVSGIFADSIYTLEITFMDKTKLGLEYNWFDGNVLWGFEIPGGVPF